MTFGRKILGTLCNTALVFSLSAACSTVDEGESASPRPEYRLSTGDRLKVTVFGETQASGIHEVDSTGSIAPALIGRLPVQGMTVPQVEQAIREEYRTRSILLNPNISVEAVQLRPFFILGEVEKRGAYPYISGLTVAQAVAVAGGYTYRASRGRITIHRQSSGQTEIAKENSIVYPGDVIRVPERYF